MWFLAAVLAGYLLDLKFGDPVHVMHPVRFIGKMITFWEKEIRATCMGKIPEIIGGTLLLATVTLTTYGFYAALLAMTNRYLGAGGLFVVESFAVYQLLATRCLADEGRKIFHALKMEDIAESRKAISYLVSRDTENMTKKDIVKATIETISENIADGIISPLFLFIGGVPLAYAFKAVSTLDSMVGYKNEKYQYMGFASAKADDLMNYIPARITGILIVITAFFLRYDAGNAFKIMIRDRHNHASPNSPYPEAAVAGALGIKLGGRASYFGVMAEKPSFGDEINEITIYDIEKTNKILYATSMFGFILFSAVYWSLL